MIAEQTKTQAQDRAEGTTEAARQEIAETLRDVAEKTTAMFADAERAGLIGELAAQLVDADPDYIKGLTRAVRNRKQGAAAEGDPDRQKVEAASKVILDYVHEAVGSHNDDADADDQEDDVADGLNEYEKNLVALMQRKRREAKGAAAVAGDPALVEMIAAIRQAADCMDDRSKIMAFLLQQLLLATNVEEDYQTRALEALGRELLDDCERTAQDRALEALVGAAVPTAGEAQTASLAMLARTISLMV